MYQCRPIMLKYCSFLFQRISFICFRYRPTAMSIQNTVPRYSRYCALFIPDSVGCKASICDFCTEDADVLTAVVAANDAQILRHVSPHISLWVTHSDGFCQQFWANLANRALLKTHWLILLVLVRTCPARKIIRYPLNSSNAQILCQKTKRAACVCLLTEAMGTKYYLKKETRKGLWVKPFRWEFEIIYYLR